MTKKDYELLASAIKSAKFGLEYASVNQAETKRTIEIMVLAISSRLAGDNPKFDRDKFDRACGL